jgi:pilus assembly protein TadC
MSDFIILKNRSEYAASNALMDISKSVHGMYRLLECKKKTVTDEELAELEEIARRAEKIYQRIKGDEL